MLLYNGDVDTICSFLHAQGFVEDLAAKSGIIGVGCSSRVPISTVSNQNDFSRYHHRNVVAGYKKRFQFPNVTLDLATVKVSR